MLSDFERSSEIQPYRRLEVRKYLLTKKSLILVNECIKLQTMHFQRVTCILYPSKFFHKVIRNTNYSK